MSQQINFLKTLQQEPIRLTSRIIALSVVSTLSFLVFVSLYIAMQQLHYSFKIKQAEQKNNEVSVDLQKTQQQYPLLVNKNFLIQQVVDLETNLQVKKKECDAITHASEHLGFSNYLLSLTQLIPAGVWLDEISIDQGTGKASLHGYAMKSEDSPILLQNLQSSLAFSRFQFESFTLKAIPNLLYSQFKISNNKPDNVTVAPTSQQVN